MSCILADVNKTINALEVPNELYTDEKIEQVTDSTMVVRKLISEARYIMQELLY